MEPILPNTTSKACGDAIPSGCIPYNGNMPSCIPICKGDTINEMFYKLGQQMCYIQSLLDSLGANSTVFSNNTSIGEWIDFALAANTSGSIGSGSGYQVVTTSPSLFGPLNSVAYKWTSVGDLLFRGGLTLSIFPGASDLFNFVRINLTSIPPSYFPTGFTTSATMLLGSYVVNGGTLMVYLHIDKPTGLIQLCLGWNIANNSDITIGLSLDAIQFNLN